MNIKKKNIIQGYLFLVPIFLLMGTISLYPLLRTIILSFHDVKLASINKMQFSGWKNYLSIFKRVSPSFWKDIFPNTVYYVFGSLVGQIGLGFVAALLVNQKFLKARGIFRSIIILPWIVSGIIISISWRFMYDPRVGILNFILSSVGVTELPTWLNNPNTVLASLVIANIWHGMPFSFIIQTSGLQSIPEEIYEAGIVDGASAWQRLRYITLPMIKQFMVINIVMCSMNTINSFDLIYAMTKGGPLFRSEVMAVHMYRRAFDFGKLGEGAAMSVLILCFNLILTIIYLRINREKARN